MDIKKATDQQLVNELASRNDFPVLAMLYLELSHVVIAKTEKELILEAEVESLKRQLNG
ncbi:hypothetical protein LCGC14_1789940 [marine sediment metagenome]|uniref:Uncharacterized protein n=1 Tax=marine sediment metagenome TaxID=412755 RepID=A0A0F9GSY1_9ZZZZ